VIDSAVYSDSVWLESEPFLDVVRVNIRLHRYSKLMRKCCFLGLQVMYGCVCRACCIGRKLRVQR